MKGNNVLLVTPFKENFEIDYVSLSNLVEFVTEKGCEGIIALGTTGEFFSLTLDEKKKVSDFIISKNNSRLPICIGVGHSGTSISIELAKYAESNGADSLLLPPPYYYPTTSEGMYTHFSEVLESVGIDVMLYDGASGIEIPVDIMVRLKQNHSNLKYIKASFLKSDKVKNIVNTFGTDLNVFCGDEVKLMFDLKDGAIGMATATGNVLPDISTKVCQLFNSGYVNEAHDLFNSKVAPWVLASGIIKSEFIRFHKEALCRMGVIKNAITRPPLCGLTPSRISQLDHILKYLNK